MRIAAVRFSATQGLTERLKKLVAQHLLPLQLKYMQLPMYTLHADSAFVQYLQLLNPVLKILFHAAAHYIKVCPPVIMITTVSLPDRTIQNCSIYFQGV